MHTQQKHTGVQNFNFAARVLHWLMAVLILAMLFIGVGMMSSLSLRPWLIDLHRPLGIAILLLAILRLGNRLLSATPPLLYMLMLCLPLLGWATLSAGNWPVTMFAGWNLPPIAPVSSVLYAWFRAAHGLFAWLLFLLVLGHLCAALIHAWIYRDGVFSSITRKAPGK